MFPCLVYHGIGDGPDRYSVSRRSFEAQLSVLLDQYCVESFSGLERRIARGSAQPPKYLVLTIDDGLKSASWAAETLQRAGFSATIFVTQNRCRNDSRFIDEIEIRDLCRRGFSFGTHGVTHQKLTHMPIERCMQELEQSKRWLEDLIGEEIRYMAAPGGYLTPRIAQLAHSIGYTLIGTSRESMNSLATSSIPMVIGRVSVRPQFSLNTFGNMIKGRRSFYLSRQLRSLAVSVPKMFFC
jgi:peptidoglycan/xylan/chitin deacetylase (PgdA/CDA1 family)